MWYKKDFLNQKKNVIKYFTKNGVSEKTISDYSSVGVPIIVYCEFIIEEFPEHKDLCQKKIKEIKDFYNIKDKVEETCGTCDVFCGEEHCITRRKDEKK